MASSPLAWSQVRASTSRRPKTACASPQSSTAAAAPGHGRRNTVMFWFDGVEGTLSRAPVDKIGGGIDVTLSRQTDRICYS